MNSEIRSAPFVREVPMRFLGRNNTSVFAFFVALCACSAESSAPPPSDAGASDTNNPPGVCSELLSPADNCGGIRSGYVAVCNTDRVTKRPGDRCTCFQVSSWGCRYATSDDAGIQRSVLECGYSALDTPKVRFRFREPVDGLAQGRVLVLGTDFTVEELVDEWAFAPPGTRGYFRATEPVRGELIATVAGPPRFRDNDRRPGATIPTLRIVGRLCASRLSARIHANTSQE